MGATELESSVDISAIANCDQSIDCISAATNGFSEANFLYKTPYGRVFKGTLWGAAVSVKVCSPAASLYTFKREVWLLHRLRHPHILSLYGASWADPSRRCILREYALGSSLHFRLGSRHSSSTFTLNWVDRVRIASEITSALVFLHDMRVVHRNVHPGNILLDACNTCKLEGFELAVRIPEGVEGIRCTPQGTPGYIDPSYSGSTHLTLESDIYGLGITILQLVLGEARAAVVHDMLDAGGQTEPSRDIDREVARLLPLADREAGASDENQVAEILALALKCAEHSPQFRPNLKDRIQPELKIIADAAMEHAFMGEPSPSEGSSPKIESNGDDCMSSKRLFSKRRKDLELPSDFESRPLRQISKESRLGNGAADQTNGGH